MATMKALFLSIFLPLLLLLQSQAAPFDPDFEDRHLEGLVVDSRCMVEILTLLCNKSYFNPLTDDEVRGTEQRHSLQCRGDECRPATLKMNYCDNITEPPRKSVKQRPVGFLPEANNANPECDRYFDRSKMDSLHPRCRQKLSCICRECCPSVNAKNSIFELLISKLPQLPIKSNTDDWSRHKISTPRFSNVALPFDSAPTQPQR